MDKENILMEFEVTILAAHVLIVAVATIGNVQWLKNWINPKRKRTYSLLSLFLLVINVTMQMPFINSLATFAWNLMTLSNAAIQFGYDAIIQGIPNLINKAMGGKAQGG